MKFLDYFHRSRLERDMEEELRSHIQHRADDLERSGLTRPEAERRARIEFGGRERYKEEIREALGSTFVETLIQDARFSLRVLRKSPGFALTAIVTLALAIGANVVVFRRFERVDSAAAECATVRKPLGYRIRGRVRVPVLSQLSGFARS